MQGLQLDKDLLAQLLVLLEGNLLQGDYFLRWSMDSFFHNSTSTLSEHFISNEIRDSECDSSLSQRLVTCDQLRLVLT